MFQSLQKCLELRDKYMTKSRQRLGDSPKDFDGNFSGLDDERAGVAGVRPDANFAANQPPSQTPERWTIYPPPPPPHWHWTDNNNVMSTDGRPTPAGEFNFEECNISSSDSRVFAIDETGVFQVYENAAKSTSSLSFFVHHSSSSVER